MRIVYKKLIPQNGIRLCLFMYFNEILISNIRHAMNNICVQLEQP